MKERDYESLFITVEALLAAKKMSKETLATHLNCTPAYLPVKLERIKAGEISLKDILTLEEALGAALVQITSETQGFIEAQRKLTLGVTESTDISDKVESLETVETNTAGV